MPWEEGWPHYQSVVVKVLTPFGFSNTIPAESVVATLLLGGVVRPGFLCGFHWQCRVKDFTQKKLNFIEREGRGGINGQTHYSVRWEDSILKDTLIF